MSPRYLARSLFSFAKFLILIASLQVKNGKNCSIVANTKQKVDELIGPPSIATVS